MCISQAHLRSYFPSSYFLCAIRYLCCTVERWLPCYDLQIILFVLRLYLLHSSFPGIFAETLHRRRLKPRRPPGSPVRDERPLQTPALHTFRNYTALRVYREIFPLRRNPLSHRISFLFHHAPSPICPH